MSENLSQTAPALLEPYCLLRRLGRGGMGTVYLGERTRDFHQQVAIKLLKPGLHHSGSEAGILSSLEHPAIVRLLDRGVLADARSYLVMEYVEGEEIDQFCRSRNLALRDRLNVLLQAAEAVEYAHSRFVLHADLKPQNILVTPAGEVKLLDFGLALLMQEGGAEMKRVLFTPGFSSPEQEFGRKLTVLSDVYSLGQVAKVVLKQQGVRWPLDLEAALTKACRREPEERYRSVREFAADLRAYQEKRPVSAYRHSSWYRWRRSMARNPAISALMALLLLIAIGFSAGVAIKTLGTVRHRREARVRIRELATLTGKLQGDLYASLPAGPSSDSARQKLLQATAQTLGNLARDDEQDPVLRREIADQYRRLAQLQQQQGQGTAAALSLRAASTLEPAR